MSTHTTTTCTSALLLLTIGTLATLAASSCGQVAAKTEDPTAAITSKNRATFERIVDEGINGKNSQVLDELFAPSLVDHDLPPGSPPGPEGTKAKLAYFRSAFPDAHFTFESALAENDTIAGRGYFTGTHQGEFLGVAPTGKTVKVNFMDLWRFSDGKVEEYWGQPDIFGLMKQLGVAANSPLVSTVEAGQNQTGQAFMRGFRNNSPAELTALYAADATYFPTDEMSVTGTKEIRTSFDGFLGAFEVKDADTSETHHVTCGDLSIGWGKWSGTLAPKSGGKAFPFEGRFTDVSKLIDGKWVYIFDHASFPTTN